MKCSAKCLTGSVCKINAVSGNTFCKRHEAVKVEIIFTRHACSCANTIQRFGTARDQNVRFGYVDPELSSSGLRDVDLKYLVHLPRNVSAVMCSTMLRAQETASHLFSNRTITVVPYIKEIGLVSGENKLSSSPKDQMAVLGTGFAEKIDYQYVTKNSGGVEWTKNAHDYNYRKFLLFVANWATNKSKETDMRRFRIVVVTHSLVMMEIFGTRDMPQNLCMAVKRFWVTDRKNINLSDDTPEVLSFDTTTKGVPFLGVPLPAELTYRDIARCRIKVPITT
jgi:broad specificity phosphatase PhoE